MTLDHERIKKELEKTNRLIEDVETLMKETVHNVSEGQFASLLSKRIRLAGIKGKLEYMLTVF